MPAFRVPSDLADKDLTIQQVIEILANRRKGKLIQTKLNGLAGKKQSYQAELAAIATREAELLDPTP